MDDPTPSDDDGSDSEDSSSATEELDEQQLDLKNTDWLDEDDEKYLKYMQSLDPRSWKKQDHYKVLGLSQLRYRATKEQIRTAYRRKVLYHHPDKRQHRDENFVIGKQGEEDYFTCITRAYETLGHVHKRRAYDSVDPAFDDRIPTAGDIAECTSSRFFDIFGPVFERNSRWSKRKPVPVFGDESTPFSLVDKFYSFWFDFPSWREFSYLDEEDKERGECREERRWIEKQNKAVREKRRKDEVKRIRNLVDLAYANDPRIASYKETERKKKESEKLARKEAQRLKKEQMENERRAAEEAERLRNEQEENTRRREREEERKLKEIKKKALQKERKALLDRCKLMNYFAISNEERLKNMEDVDKLCKLLDLERLKSLNLALEESAEASHAEIFRQQVTQLNNDLEAEKAAIKAVLESKKKNEEGCDKGSKSAQWTEEELQLLVKAATLFPVGTKSRWEIVAAFINEHRKEESSAKLKTARDVIGKAKELQDASGKENIGISKVGLVTSKKDHTVAECLPAPTERTEHPAELQGQASWSAAEQKLLEQALRTYPASTPERWDRIAECIPGKTKKDCMRRFKELAELVRAKKVAQEKVQRSENMK